MTGKDNYKYSNMVEKIVGSMTINRLKREIDDIIARLYEKQQKENTKLLKENLNLKYENRYLYKRLLNNKNNF